MEESTTYHTPESNPFSPLGDLDTVDTESSKSEVKSDIKLNTYATAENNSFFTPLGDLTDNNGSAGQPKSSFTVMGDILKNENEKLAPESKNKPIAYKNKSRHTWKYLVSVAACCALILTITLIFVTQKNSHTITVALADVGDKIETVEAHYLNDDGYIEPNATEALLNEVHIMASELENVTHCEKNQLGVYMVIDNSVGVHYNAPIDGLASSGSDVAIYSYQPYHDIFADNSVDWSEVLIGNGTSIANPLLDGDYPDKAVQNLVSLNETASAAKKYNDEEVTIERLKELSGNSVIIWVGHGGYSSEYHSTLCLFVEYTEKIYKDYKEDFDTHRLEISYTEGEYRVCVTSKFFDYYLDDNALENSIIYLGACSSGRDNVLASTFLGKGASAVYCNSNDVFQQYNNRMCRSVINALCKGATVNEALNIAREEYGPKDNVIFGLFKTDAQVCLKGDKGFTLSKLYEQINSSETPDSTSNPPLEEKPPAEETHPVEESQPIQDDASYVGTWLYDYYLPAGTGKIVITEKAISIYTPEGVNEGPYTYSTSRDEYYTYLNFTTESGEKAFVAYINHDMIGLWIGEAKDNGYILYRQGAGTTDYEVPDSYYEIFDTGDYYEYLYFPAAKVLYVWNPGIGFFPMYVHGDGSLEYMEIIVLINDDLIEQQPSNAVFTDSNFVIEVRD